jgi:hypothetical protein
MSNNSDRRQTISTILRLAAAIFFLGMSHAASAAQSLGGQASVARTAPGAILYGGGRTPSALRKGAILQPGDMIYTGVSGHVVIDLSDGSQVVIFPGSRVELKDFQSGGSWRDLLRVMVGRVRATISHQGKRPNPYRVFSPVASIAVRGTDFLVAVELSGETRVLVYEGLVEVGSLVNPQKRVLVRPGRNIIVRSDGDISLMTAAPRGELNEIRSLRFGGDQESNLRDAYTSRFTAFTDSHIDSLRNPAYATEFRHPSGRLSLVPSFSPEFETGYAYGYDGSYSHSSVYLPNYTLSPQVSYFIPLGSRIVVGAGAAVTKTDVGRSAESFFNGLNQYIGYNYYRRDGRFTTANLSLIAASQFGRAGRTSFGMKFDYLIDRSSYSFNRGTDESRNSEPALEEGKARGRRAGLSVGVTQDAGDDKKLGVYYRYSMGSVENSYRRSGFWGFVNDDPHYFSGSEVLGRWPGHSSEAGVLFRGPVTRRLFYGVESSILFGQDQVETHFPISTTIGAITYNSTQTYLNKRRVRRGMIGVGIGYALRPRTVLSLDLSTGRAREDSLGQSHYSSLPPGIRYSSYDNFARERTSFKAVHIGGQTDIWRNLFAGGSLFIMREEKRSSSGLDVPEEYRGSLTNYSQELSSYKTYTLSNLSAGWRLTPSWIAQYVYYTSYGRNVPSHTLVIRHEFGRREEKSPTPSER